MSGSLRWEKELQIRRQMTLAVEPRLKTHEPSDFGQTTACGPCYSHEKRGERSEDIGLSKAFQCQNSVILSALRYLIMCGFYIKIFVWDLENWMIWVIIFPTFFSVFNNYLLSVLGVWKWTKYILCFALVLMFLCFVPHTWPPWLTVYMGHKTHCRLTSELLWVKYCWIFHMQIIS